MLRSQIPYMNPVPETCRDRVCDRCRPNLLHPARVSTCLVVKITYASCQRDSDGNGEQYTARSMLWCSPLQCIVDIKSRSRWQVVRGEHRTSDDAVVPNVVVPCEAPSVTTTPVVVVVVALDWESDAVQVVTLDVSTPSAAVVVAVLSVDATVLSDVAMAWPVLAPVVVSDDISVLAKALRDVEALRHTHKH